MKPEVILIVAGCVLCLAASVGGNLHSKWLAIPKISTDARVLSAIFGLLLVGLGIWVNAGLPWWSASRNEQSAKDVVKYTIQLSSSYGGNLGETVTIYLDNKYLGSLTVDQKNPTIKYTGTVSMIGDHAYRITYSRYMQPSLTYIVHDIIGSGSVEIEPDSLLTIDLGFDQKADRETVRLIKLK